MKLRFIDTDLRLQQENERLLVIKVLFVKKQKTG